VLADLADARESEVFEQLDRPVTVEDQRRVRAIASDQLLLERPRIADATLVLDVVRAHQQPP
jgi:hypothetical protein